MRSAGATESLLTPSVTPSPPPASLHPSPHAPHHARHSSGLESGGGAHDSGGPTSSPVSGRPSFPLLSIFFAEFDNTVGPQITCQSPEGFLSDEIFDSISDFMITDHSLCHKLVTVAAFDYTIIGYPMSLSHKKYHRNALLFNVAFVFPRDVNAANCAAKAKAAAAARAEKDAQMRRADSAGGGGVAPAAAAAAVPSFSAPSPCSSQATATQLRPYHAVIRKLATIIESLEVESEFLFRPESKRMLQGLVDKVFRSLNACGECSVLLESTVREHVRPHLAPSSSAAASSHSGAAHSKSATAQAAASSSRLDDDLDSEGGGGGANKINLKLYPLLALPPRHVPGFLVPVPVKDLESRWKLEWDLTLRQVIPFMDGVNYVSKIATLSGIHLSLVTKCVRQLLYYEAIQLVDIFQYSNRYAPTPQLARACSDVGASEEERLRARRLRSDARRVCRADPERPRPPFALLFRIMTALGPNVTLGEVLRNLHTFEKQPATRGSASPPQPQPISLEAANIHPRKFIQFAVINGLLRRVYLYPLLLPPGCGSGSGGAASLLVPSHSHSHHIKHSPSLSGMAGPGVQGSSGGGGGGGGGAPLAGMGLGSGSGGAGGGGGIAGSGSGSSSSFPDLSFFGLVHGRQALLEEALARQLAAQKARAATARALAQAHSPQAAAATALSAHSKGMFRGSGGGGGIGGPGAGGAVGAPNGSATGASGSVSHEQQLGGNGDPSLGSAPHLSHSSSSGGMSGALGGSGGSSSSSSSVSFRSLERYLDGAHHFDELCCLFGRSFVQLEEEIRRSKRCVILAK